MITVEVYPLALGQRAMFRRTFNRWTDAADCVAFFKKIGQSHVKVFHF